MNIATIMISRDNTPNSTQIVISIILGFIKSSLKHFSEEGIENANLVVNFKNESKSHSPTSLQVMFLWLRSNSLPLYHTDTLYFLSSSMKSSHSMSDSKGTGSRILNPYAFKTAAKLESWAERMINL